MKLIFAIKRLESAVGGAERVMCELCSELAARGHSVTVITFDRVGSKPFYYLDERIVRIELGIGDTARKANINETLRRSFALRKTIAKKDPDVVIGFMHSMFILLAFSLIGTGIKIVGSEHIVPEHYRSRPLQYILLLLSALFLDKITVLSESIRERYPKIIRKKMIAQANPVMLVKKQASIVTNKSTFILLNVGRLEEQKDQGTLLKAFSFINKTYPGWKLRIIGEGKLRTKLEKMIIDLQIQNQVEMPGVTNHIEDEYSAADLFVLSSRYESFGLVTAEAMSFGLPVIGFDDCPGTNELIKDGTTGLLAKAINDRAKSLSKALDILMSNSEARIKIGMEGKKYIENKYKLQNICIEWEKILMDICISERN